MAQLWQWCKGEDLNPLHAILVKDVEEQTEVSFIEETLQTIKALGIVRVRGRVFDPQGQCLTVLCECREKVNTPALPLDVLPEGRLLPWRIFGPSDEEKVSPNAPLRDEAQEPGKRFPLRESTPEAIIRAVGDIMQRTSRPTSDSYSYRRLRIFSGVTPTPAGEEPLDNWIEQARLMIDECDRSDRDKRMKIMESVKGPALEILQAVRFNNPDATPIEYIDVIENTFGTPETGEELYFSFRLLCQHSSEKLSEFLRRMESLLNKVVKKGGLRHVQADKARLDQLIKGATRSDMMLLNLRLREQRQQPPSFLQLLNEIRTEEEYEASRRKLTPIKSVHVKIVIPAEADIRDLGAEIQELKSQVHELTAWSTATSPSRPALQHAGTTETDSIQDTILDHTKERFSFTDHFVSATLLQEDMFGK